MVGGDLRATWHGVRPRPRLLSVVNIGGRAELRLRSNAAISHVILYTPAYSITGTYWNPQALKEARSALALMSAGPCPLPDRTACYVCVQQKIRHRKWLTASLLGCCHQGWHACIDMGAGPSGKLVDEDHTRRLTSSQSLA